VRAGSVSRVAWAITKGGALKGETGTTPPALAIKTMARNLIILLVFKWVCPFTTTNNFFVAIIGYYTFF
jgi:hypothetical protein